MSERIGSIVIEAVTPQIDEGRHPVKRVVGELVRVEADIFKEGHDLLAAAVRWRQLTPVAEATGWTETPMVPLSNDRWAAEFPVARNGRYVFTLEAWPDGYRTWADELTRKVKACVNVHSELLEGAAFLKAAAERAEKAKQPRDAKRLLEAARLFSGDAKEAFTVATEAALLELGSKYADRSIMTRSGRELEVFVDREKAQTSAWYEFFPRSAARGDRHGTFKDAEALLPEVDAMGFDVVYLPPIHPIGTTARKGKNNAPKAQPDDVGSPWAIGSEEGGHKAVHPLLGTLEDFRRFVGRAAEYGMDVALDLAYQCSPDHPYVREHPEWFLHRPDGTIKTAENPPKRYEDIVNFDWLGPNREALWNELKSVVLFWIDQGVTLFRVDNPHTKPVPFWKWLIREVQDVHPEAVFLAEAFTRPKMMKQLAKVGFSQGYTYFTWRNFKDELEAYLTELTQTDVAETLRGNLWPNTPDILPEILQRGGPAAFKLRLALAATLSSSYGIYSGYELCEGHALQGEEYLDSEKYQLVRWDPNRPGNIRAFVAAINRVRRENPALRLYKNLRFYPSDNERVLFYGKSTPDGTNQILIAVSLDPFEPQDATLEVPLEALGIPETEAYEVEELLEKKRLLWTGPSAKVELTPDAPCAIWSVRRFTRKEASFDYFF